MTLEEAIPKASPMLRIKIRHSVELIRKAEKLSKMYDAENGFFLAFSGGKDSQALYHIAELSGCDFKAHFSPTTVDPPQVIRFIRTHYPDVEFGKVRQNIYRTAVEKQILPTMRVRWCCAEYKEMAGAGKVTLIGIRHAESSRRAKRKEVEISNRKFSGTFEEFLDYREDVIRKKYKNLNFDQFAEHSEQMVSCINGKDSILVSPIIDWTERDVWEFLNKVMEVEHCELYDKGYRRIGCILCPMSSYKQKLRECRDFPYVKEKWIEAIKLIRQGGVSQDKHTEYLNRRGGQSRPLRGQCGVGWTPTTTFGGESEGTTQRTDSTMSDKEGNCSAQFGHRYTKEQFNNLNWGGNPRSSQGVCEKTKGYGRQVACPTENVPDSEEIENQIAENIFDWWISGKPYDQWYFDKFKQLKLDI